MPFPYLKGITVTDIYKVPAGDAPQLVCHAPIEHGLGCTCLVGPSEPQLCTDGLHDAGCDHTKGYNVLADAESVHDPVANPSHYTGGRFPTECRRWTDLMSFDAGNAFKYVWRHADKSDPIQDLEKAITYLGFLEETGGSVFSAHAMTGDRELAKSALINMLEEVEAEGIYSALYSILIGKPRMAKLLISAEIGALQHS